MIGVLMVLAALIISLIRGTPNVTFMDATPAKWKVFSVIWVPGSPIDWAPTAPTVDPEYREDGANIYLPQPPTWLDLGADVFGQANRQKPAQLRFGNLGLVINNFLLCTCPKVTTISREV
jgi:hypothetical protein